MKLEEGTTKRSKWKAIIFGIIATIVGIGIDFIIAVNRELPPDLDDPPFGLMLPDSVTDNWDAQEKEFLKDFPDTWECQAYLIDDRVDSVVDFYLDSVADWGEANYTIGEISDSVGHLLIYAKGEDDVLLILVMSPIKAELDTELVILGYEAE